MPTIRHTDSCLTIGVRALTLLLVLGLPLHVAAQPLGPVPSNARLALTETWSSGSIDPAKWYSPYKKWGQGNNGVDPHNVRLARDTVAGHEKNVLVLKAHGDQYLGPVVGYDNQPTRVGGMLISKEFFASGRYEVVMKIGSTSSSPGGPADPMRPKGAVPALWTYAYRYVEVPASQMNDFVPATPLYNPHMRVYGIGANEYWSELDFPEFGKDGNFDLGLYNTFLQNRHQPKTYDVSAATDGQYHTFTTEWRTKLEPLSGVTDAQVVESEGFWWVRDKSIAFDRYLGNPLKRLGPNQYALYRGDRVDHWIDGEHVAENTLYVPSMAAQLTMGIWLPQWAGPAPWATATASIASAKIWQYDDPGDVRGVLTSSIENNYSPSIVLGDLNGDGVVNAGDWSTFKSRFRHDTSHLNADGRLRAGDFDRSGQIDSKDFIAFRGIFQSAAASGVAIPEPASLIVLGTGWFILPRRRRRGARQESTGRRFENTSFVVLP